MLGITLGWAWNLCWRLPVTEDGVFVGHHATTMVPTEGPPTTAAPTFAGMYHSCARHVDAAPGEISRAAHERLLCICMHHAYSLDSAQLSTHCFHCHSLLTGSEYNTSVSTDMKVYGMFLLVRMVVLPLAFQVWRIPPDRHTFQPLRPVPISSLARTCQSLV